MVKRLAKGSCDWRNLLYFDGGYLCLNKLNNPEYTAWSQTESFLNSDRLQPRLYLRGCFKGNKPRHEDLNVFADFSDCVNQSIEEIADKILSEINETDVLLVKASRNLHFEEIISEMKEKK